MRNEDDQSLSMNGEILLDEVKNGLMNLDFKQLPPIERGLDSLQRKLKQQKFKSKDEIRQKLMKSLKINKINLEELSSIVQKVKKHDDRLLKEEKALEKLYKYDDKERVMDLETYLNQPLAVQIEELGRIQLARDQFKLEIDKLESAVFCDVEKEEDEILLWQDLTIRCEDLSNKILGEVEMAKVESQKAHRLSEELANIQDKYKDKDKIIRKCKDSKTKKMEKVEQLRRNQKNEEKKLKELMEQINNVQIPIESELLSKEEIKIFKIKSDQLQKSLIHQKNKVDQIQDKITQICQPIANLPQEVVGQLQLQQVHDELNKLDVLISDLNEDLKGKSDDREQLENNLLDFIQGNKNKYLEEAENLSRILADFLRNLDKESSDVGKKLISYNTKLKDGIRTFEGEDDILSELKSLKGDADGLGQDFKKLENMRGQIGNRDRQLRDTLAKYKSGKVQPTAQDISALAQKFNCLQIECSGIQNGLSSMSDDLDDRIVYLDRFILKGKELQDLFRLYDDSIQKLTKEYQMFESDLERIAILQSQLNQVVDQMHLGLERDYIGQDESIKSKLELLLTIQKTLEDLTRVKEKVKAEIMDLQSQKIDNFLSADPHEISQQLPQYQDYIQKIGKMRNTIDSVRQQLTFVKEEVGVANVPKNIKVREAQFQMFNQQVKEFEQDFIELKKLMGVVSPSEQHELKLMEIQLTQFIEDKVQCSRVLRQDLLPHQHQQTKLQALPVLREVIKKIRDLGDQLIDSLNALQDFRDNVIKMKNDLEERGVQHKWKLLSLKEEDLTGKLSQINKRFQLIKKGGEDCDGYTTGSEEELFIGNLNNEISDILEKELILSTKLDEIHNLLQESKDSLSQNEGIQSKVFQTQIQKVEEQIGIAQSGIQFLENLAEQLEEKFINMKAQKKLQRRQAEITESKNVTISLSNRLTLLKEQIDRDQDSIMKQSSYLKLLGINPQEDKSNDDLIEVLEELRNCSTRVVCLFHELDQFEQQRLQVLEDFTLKVGTNTFFTKKNLKKQEQFLLLELNSHIKGLIRELMSKLRSIIDNFRKLKNNYHQLRKNYGSLLSRRLYSAVSGDIVDEQVAEYINNLNFEVPIQRLGMNQYTLGARKIVAQMVNEKLMVRVGGGYVGMDEFMMVYGSTELMKIQREEDMKDTQYFDYIRSEVLFHYFKGYILEQEQLDIGSNQTEIEQLKQKIKQDYEKRKFILHRSHDIDNQDTKTYEGKKPVVGINHAREAIKKNIKTITVTESFSSLKNNKTQRQGTRPSQSPTRLTNTSQNMDFIAKNRLSQGKILTKNKHTFSVPNLSKKQQ